MALPFMLTDVLNFSSRKQLFIWQGLTIEHPRKLGVFWRDKKLVLKLFPRAGLKTGAPRECEVTRNKENIRKRSRVHELSFRSAVC